MRAGSFGLAALTRTASRLKLSMHNEALHGYTGKAIPLRFMASGEPCVCIKKGKGELMDPVRIMDGLSKELNSALKAMSKAKDVDEKEVYSRIVKNLCDSLGVFLDLASEMMPLDFDDDLEKEDIPF